MEEYHASFTEYLLAAQLFSMTAELFAEKTRDNQYVRKVKNYIKHSYMNNISIEEIARAVSLDRGYLSRLFKKETGRTMQEYLIGVRMKHARILLRNGKTVTETATLCGYTDVYNFSKMFKKTQGISPSELQKNGSATEIIPQEQNPV